MRDNLENIINEIKEDDKKKASKSERIRRREKDYRKNQ